MTNKNIIRMETNVPVLEQENIQETLALNTLLNVISCAPTSRASHICHLRNVWVQKEISLGVSTPKYICKGRKRISILLEHPLELPGAQGSWSRDRVLD